MWCDPFAYFTQSQERKEYIKDMKRIHFLEDDALNSWRKVRKEQKDKKWVRKEKVAESFVATKQFLREWKVAKDFSKDTNLI